MLLIFLHIFCYDVWYYISHIILHKPKIYVLVHKTHHSTPTNKLHYTSAHVAHYAENIVQPLGIFVPCFIAEYSTTSLITSFIIISIRNALRHDDRFSWLIGNHHILHHKFVNYNFGEYWIDCLCGTCYPKKEYYVYGKICT
jgi:sterol desaturase/sphingolipid hydroxylase (fatty acid hydroxylase superfamily)